MSQVRLSPKSEQDLDEIWLYIARDNPEAATRFITRLQTKCSLLADSPRIGRRREELGFDLRSFPVGDFLIFYRPTKLGIEVARFLHGHRDREAEFDR